MNPRYPFEPRWYAPGAPGLRLPINLKGWLVHQGSLTQRIRYQCAATFWVEVLQQLQDLPLASERSQLAMQPRELALIRRVRLCCGEQPLVYARSLIPMRSLQGAGRQLKFLGNRPLGSVLFSDPKASRGPMEFARLLPGHRLFEQAAFGLDPQPAEFWGRRTLFFFAGKPLLVNEVFLPRVTGMSELSS